MKNYIYIILTLLAIVGCTGRQGEGHPTGADSLYTYTYIFLHHIQEPERCLSLIDTAEQRGLMSIDSCNWMRGQIYYACLNDQANADEYLHRVLDRPELDHASDVYLTALSTYCTFSLHSSEYVRALEHATEGARLAHEAGNVRFEAEFNGVAGAAIEHKRPGAGIDYLDRAISLIRQQDDRQLLPKASYYMSEKARIQIEQEQYAEAATTCRERLALIDEMQQRSVFVTEGYFDMQLARTYAKLALCLQNLGKTAEARRAAEAFSKTNFAKTMKGKHDIMHYYVMTDDRQRVEQLFSELEDYYQQGDTINEDFRSIILEKAKWYHHHGEWRETAQALARATGLRDSLILRDQQPYTDCNLNRDTLAQMLGTNYNYLADAIRECTGGMTLSDFLDDYRISHAAQLLTDTDNPVGLVAEMSGFASRSHFNTLFREKYKMTPSEYRNVAKEKTKEHI